VFRIDIKENVIMMKYNRFLVLIILTIIVVFFSGCTEQHQFSYNTSELSPNEIYKVEKDADETIEIGYSWKIIDKNTSINEIIFRIISPSGKEIIKINTSEESKLYEGSINCEEDGIYELSWENTDSNNTIIIKYGCDWVQERAMLYTFICYIVFLILLVTIIVIISLLYKKHKRKKMLEKGVGRDFKGHGKKLNALENKELKAEFGEYGGILKTKDERILAKLYRFFWLNEKHPNLVNNIGKIGLIGFAVGFLTITALYFLPFPATIHGWGAVIIIFGLFGGSFTFAIGGLLVPLIAYIIAWIYTKNMKEET